MHMKVLEALSWDIGIVLTYFLLFWRICPGFLDFIFLCIKSPKTRKKTLLGYMDTTKIWVLAGEAKTGRASKVGLRAPNCPKFL